MDDNKKFSIREYRQALYADIVKRKKEQRKKWQAKYLNKLGVTTQENKDQYNSVKKEKDSPKNDDKKDDDRMRNVMMRTEEKYHRPITSSSNKTKDRESQGKYYEKDRTMNYSQYQSKGRRPPSGVKRQ